MRFDEYAERSDFIASQKGYQQSIPTDTRPQIAFQHGVLVIIDSIPAAAGAALMGVNELAGALILAGVITVFVFAVCGFFEDMGKLRADEELQRDIARARYIPKEQPLYAPGKTVADFAPLVFVNFIWKYYDSNGRFPTLDHCVRFYGDSTVSRSLFQDWYEAMTRAGAIIGRDKHNPGGRPADGWSRAEFEQSAKLWESALPQVSKS